MTRNSNDEFEPSWAPPPSSCTVEITFRIGVSTPLASTVFRVQYGEAPGAFPGSAGGVQCEQLNAVEGIEASFSDDEASSTLQLSLEAVASTPIQGPKEFARCTWVPTSRLPTKEDFRLNTSTALTFADGKSLYPQSTISKIECTGDLPTSTSTTTTTLPPATLCGDFDGNGTVVASDALSILRASVGLVQCPVCVCDVDGSGSTTVSDALAVLLKSVGQGNDLTCSPCA